MIKNLKSLLEVNEPFKSRRKILLDIVEKTLKTIDPFILTFNELARYRKSFARYKNIYIFAVGKAAAKMACAAHEIVGKRLTKGIAIIPKGSKHVSLSRVKFFKASHPFPCDSGLRAAKSLAELAEKTTKNDLVIFLLSGGGSALMPLPIDGLSLEEKISITRSLIKSKAAINEINIVRKALSKLKGGKLAKLLYPSRVLCFVISDVVGNDPSTIASGPLSPCGTTSRDALKILKKYKIPLIKFPKSEIPEPPDAKYFRRISYKIIADHHTTLKTVKRIACQFNPKCAFKLLTGEARTEGPRLLKKARKGLLIASGETTVDIKGSGQGGRNQELVLSCLKHIKPNQTILSIGTDGVDGITPVPIAGALADSLVQNPDPISYLKNNDSYAYFKKQKTLIKTGPTGNNIGDLTLILTS